MVYHSIKVHNRRELLFLVDLCAIGKISCRYDSNTHWLEMYPAIEDDFTYIKQQFLKKIKNEKTDYRRRVVEYR